MSNEVSSIARAPKGAKKDIHEVRSVWERIRLQVDSGAVDTVAPKHIVQAFELRETATSMNEVGFAAASGSITASGRCPDTPTKGSASHCG